MTGEVVAGVEVEGLWRRLLVWVTGASGDLEVDAAESFRLLPLTDMDAAVLVNRLWGGRIRFVRDYGRNGVWFIWDEAVFISDTAGKIESRIRKLFANAYQRALEALSGRYRDRAERESKDEESRTGDKAAAKAIAEAIMADYAGRAKPYIAFRTRLRQAAGQSALSTSMKDEMVAAWGDFDEDCRYLAFRNGVIDLDALQAKALLRSGSGAAGLLDLTDVDAAFATHTPARLLTQCAAVEWPVGKAKVGELWDWALNRSLPSPGLREYFRRLMGGALLGEPEKRLVNLLGPTNSGKSTVLGMVGKVFGRYVHSANIELFLRGEDNDSFELDKLRKARIVTATEPEKGGVWDQALLKKLTGHDPVDTRSLYMSEEASGGDWTPRFTLFVGSNHELRFHTDDRAMSQRLCPVRFPVEFRKAEVGREPIPADELALDGLDVRLWREEPERTGIAVWCVLGMLDWLNGSGSGSEPVEVSRARSDVAERVDSAREWVRFMVEEGQLVVTPAAKEEVRMQPWVSGPGAPGVHTVSSAELLPSADAYLAYQMWCVEEQGMPERSVKRLKSFRESIADLYGEPYKSGVMRYPGLAFVVGRWKAPVPKGSWMGYGP